MGFSGLHRLLGGICGSELFFETSDELDGLLDGLALGLISLARVVHREDDVLVELAVHGELAGLSEGLVAAREVAQERLLTSVDVRVLLEVLSESEALEAEHAHVHLCLLMGRQVASQRETGRVGFVATWFFALKWSFHFSQIFDYKI